ncbi:MAG: hypothetical protein J2P37_14240 [Ktedonobacteraceae bacterium]|nr:hypothetical protein [Ktedonobacteraceae bacterium]MBO0790039.1 hypothetical protein [Ktedonobacteraceae bacterium]
MSKYESGGDSGHGVPMSSVERWDSLLRDRSASYLLREADPGQTKQDIEIGWKDLFRSLIGGRGASDSAREADLDQTKQEIRSLCDQAKQEMLSHSGQKRDAVDDMLKHCNDASNDIRGHHDYEMEDSVHEIQRGAEFAIRDHYSLSERYFRDIETQRDKMENTIDTYHEQLISGEIDIKIYSEQVDKAKESYGKQIEKIKTSYGKQVDDFVKEMKSYSERMDRCTQEARVTRDLEDPMTDQTPGGMAPSSRDSGNERQQGQQTEGLEQIRPSGDHIQRQRSETLEAGLGDSNREWDASDSAREAERKLEIEATHNLAEWNIRVIATIEDKEIELCRNRRKQFLQYIEEIHDNQVVKEIESIIEQTKQHTGEDRYLDTIASQARKDAESQFIRARSEQRSMNSRNSLQYDVVRLGEDLFRDVNNYYGQARGGQWGTEKYKNEMSGRIKEHHEQVEVIVEKYLHGLDQRMGIYQDRVDQVMRKFYRQVRQRTQELTAGRDWTDWEIEAERDLADWKVNGSLNLDSWKMRSYFGRGKEVLKIMDMYNDEAIEGVDEKAHQAGMDIGGAWAHLDPRIGAAKNDVESHREQAISDIKSRRNETISDDDEKWEWVNLDEDMVLPENQVYRIRKALMGDIKHCNDMVEQGSWDAEEFRKEINTRIEAHRKQVEEIMVMYNSELYQMKMDHYAQISQIMGEYYQQVGQSTQELKTEREERYRGLGRR